MPIATGHYTLDRTKLPAKADALRIRFVPQLVNNKNTLLVLYPDTEPGFEPSFMRYAVLMKFDHLLQGDGSVAAAQGLGQIVVTGQRLLGMITDGSMGKTMLKEAAGSVYVFALDLDDCAPVESKTNWRGKQVEAVIRSKEGQAPPFRLQIMSVDLLLKNDGQVIRASLPTFLEHLTPEGRQNLQKET